MDEALGLSPKYTVHGVRCLPDQGLRIMRVGMEILESQEAVVANFAEFFRNRWPISRSIKQGAKCFQGVIRPFLSKLFEVDVLRPFAQYLCPMLGVLKHRDVAGIEMDSNGSTSETVDEAVHFHRGHQIAIEKDVFDIQADLPFLGLAN